MRLFRALLTSSKRFVEPPAPRNTSNGALSKVHHILFHKYLLTTNTVSSGVLMVVGDLMSQEIEYRQGHLLQRYDWWRVGRMFIVGAIQGPMHHYFYGWLDRVYRIANGQNVTKKILYDQIVMSPACIAAFFYSAGWLEGRTTADCTDELKQKAVRVYVMDWTVWPAAQFVNFYYLHPRYRVVYVNLVTMVYNVFLSYIKHETAEAYAEDIQPEHTD